MYKIFWDQYVNDVRKLGELIQHGKSYQCLLSIARGGTVIGTMLSHILDIPMGVIISESYNKDKEQREVKISDIILPPSITEVKDCLIVDDLLDTGKTYEAIKEAHKDWNFDIAVLYHKDKCSRPNYWIRKIEDWVEFPYEMKN